MLNNRNFTDKDIDTILKNMVILVDTREKANTHIAEWLEYKNRCEWIKMKLNNGDYSCMLKAMPEFGITHDLYFHNEFSIERKNSLDEISQNFTKNRTRFEEELATKKGQMIIAIEDDWTNLFQGNYQSKYDRRSFIASIMAFWHRYDVPFVFLDKEEIPVFIYTHMRYFLREKLKS
jgi:ERCC4-type nuclease